MKTILMLLMGLVTLCAQPLPVMPGAEIYACPMHLDVQSKKASDTCPKCKMALVSMAELKRRGLVAEDVPVPSAGPGLRLEDLEKLALERHPALQQAEAEVRAAQGRERQAGLYPNPVLGLNGEHVAPITGGGAIGGFVEQRIPMGGKRQLDQRAASEERKASEQMRAAERQRVLNQVRALFYEALAAQRRVEVRADLAKLADRAVAITKELANVGQADGPDQLAIEIEAQRARLSLTNARNAQQRTWRQLALSVNDPDLRLQPLSGDLEAVPEIDEQQALARILAESPEMRVAEIGVTRAELLERRAKADRVPDLQLRGGLRNNREFADGGFITGLRRIGVEGIFDVGIEIPLWNRYQGQIQAAKAELDRAKLQGSRTRLALGARLAESYRQYQDARAAVGTLKEEMMPKARQAYETYLANFRLMAAAYPQVLVAQRNYFQVTEEYVAALEMAWESALEIQGLLLGH
jgi:cobalt-zinc-cadmium efflux system outer membrane protein